MDSINSPAQWLRLLLGLVLVFGLFQLSATTLGSDRGQAGVMVGALVVAATVAVERVLFGMRPLDAARTLGLGVPHPRGLAVVAGVSGLMFLVVLLFAAITRTSIDFLTGWTSWVAGLFAQAGIAEETMFRGYLFGRLRAGRSFRQAAVASMLPFVGVHLLLFFTMPWPLALASVILAVVISFPLAYLFELGGGTIWAPAVLHFVIQGTVKVVSVGGGAAFPLVWMAASALLPLLVFVVPRAPRSGPAF